MGDTGMDLEGSYIKESQSGKGISWYMKSHLGQMRADIQGNKLTSKEENLRIQCRTKVSRKTNK